MGENVGTGIIPDKMTVRLVARQRFQRTLISFICGRWFQVGWKDRKEKDRRIISIWKILLYPYVDDSKSWACVPSIEQQILKEILSRGVKRLGRRRYDVMTHGSKVLPISLSKAIGKNLCFKIYVSLRNDKDIGKNPCFKI